MALGPSSLARAGMDGATWYSDAREPLSLMAHRVNTDYPHLVDILSITSPRVQVRRNVQLARDYLLYESFEGMLPSTINALKHYRRTGEIRGPKTSAFAEALKGDETACVIDVWVLRGFGLPTNKRPPKHLESTMRGLATKAGMCVRDWQAALWCGTIRAHNRTPADLAAIIREEMSLC